MEIKLCKCGNPPTMLTEEVLGGSLLVCTNGCRCPFNWCSTDEDAIECWNNWVDDSKRI
jgi:hypothetical protein